MNKNFYILALIVFGFLGIPNTTFACRINHSNNKSYKKEVSSNQGTKDCCTTKNCTNDKKNSSCGGKCGHSNCNIPSIQTAYFIPFLTEVNSENFFFYSKKLKFFNYETPISSGFNSLWLIPKIS